ncbi:hypothetical protein SAMN05661080_04544 [Modestobacter sp. DSM 44400]|nr:hypothetical protein SAMN05661080_04544 [Modestobacter sp. DSM 44400]
MPAPACHSWGKALTTWLPLDPGADDLGAPADGRPSLSNRPVVTGR